MKYLYSAVLLFTLPAFSADLQPMKTCSARMVSLQTLQEIPVVIEIFAQDGTYRAKYTQTIDGQRTVLEDKVQITQNQLREGIRPETLDLADINIAEGLVAQAMAIEEDPVFEGRFQSGLDLKSVKSARVFQIGEATNMGMVAILEAKDKDGKDLGSFIGGSVVAACK